MKASTDNRILTLCDKSDKYLVLLVTNPRKTESELDSYKTSVMPQGWVKEFKNIHGLNPRTQNGRGDSLPHPPPPSEIEPRFTSLQVVKEWHRETVMTYLLISTRCVVCCSLFCAINAWLSIIIETQYLLTNNSIIHGTLKRTIRALILFSIT